MSDNENKKVSEEMEEIKTSTDNKKEIYMVISTFIGIALASGVGTGLGVDNLAVYMGIGAIFGAIIGFAAGSSIEKKNNEKNI